MTKEEILKEYNVDSGGRIISPGKFEGEMLYVPYYWFMALQGFSDRDDGKIFGFDITAEDRHQFPELGTRRRTVKIYERDDGFVCEI